MSELEQKLHDYECLFWLAARDIVFFSTYNDTFECWDNGFHACILCNDTFYYACADAEAIAPEESHIVKEYFEDFGWDGVVAITSVFRGSDPLKQLMTDKFLEAREKFLSRKSGGEA